jgi:hypothetical protein
LPVTKIKEVHSNKSENFELNVLKALFGIDAPNIGERCDVGWGCSPLKFCPILDIITSPSIEPLRRL